MILNKKENFQYQKLLDNLTHHPTGPFKVRELLNEPVSPRCARFFAEQVRSGKLNKIIFINHDKNNVSVYKKDL